MKRYITKTQSGLAAVEFILTLPVLILLMVGLSEIGNILIQYNTLNKSAQNGARYAVTQIYGTATYDQIAPESEIKNVVLYGSKSGGGSAVLSGLTVNDVSVSQNNSFVTITVSYDYVPFIATIPFTSTSLAINLSASSMMRTGL